MSNQDAEGPVENQAAAADGTPNTETTSRTVAEASTPQRNPEPSASASSSKPGPRCENCSKSEAELGRSLTACSKCKSVSYCSKECQKGHFKAHKKVCPGLAQEWAKGADIKMATRSSGAGRVREKGIGKWEYDT